MLRNQKGMTLAEVMAAAVILGILVIAYFNISSYTIWSEKKLDMSVEALAIAEEITNVIRSEIASNTTSLTYNISLNPHTGTIERSNHTFTYRVTRTAYSTASPQVNLSSPVPGNRQRSIQSLILLTNSSNVQIPELMVVTVSWEEVAS